MRITTIIVQNIARLCGVVLIVLGLLFWTGNALSLVSLHMFTGLLLVLALWVLALLAAIRGGNTVLVLVSVVWGLIVPILGLTQTRILPGSAHWLVQVLHLAVGIVAIVLSQVLAQRILRGGSGRDMRVASPA